jgi:ERO1-like protein alpha
MILKVLHLMLLLPVCDSISWHEGCLCELTNPNTLSLEQNKIFDTQHFRHGRKISQFCPCSISSIQKLNEVHISPTLGALLSTPFFRYFRVDLEAKCPFWENDGYCTIKQCSVEETQEEEAANVLGTAVLTRASGHELIDEHWTNELDSSWTNEGENGNFHYVDLLSNPEKYTGYKPKAGSSRVWHEVHAFNTFHSSSEKIGVVGHEGEESAKELASMPVEHRVFWKSVSGLHASISSHIAVNYLLDKRKGVWGLDLNEFQRRLVDHPDRINNLHFVFLLELRAVAILGEFLLHTDHPLSTGHPSEDRQTIKLLQNMLKTKSQWPVSFEEETAFHGDPNHHLLEIFRTKMYNISRIMDCVGCQRCRLWGKLQMMGLGTALRILYSPDREEVLRGLHRSHIVALFNAVGRLSHSVEATRLVVPLLSQVETNVLGTETEYRGDEDEDQPTMQQQRYGEHMFSFNTNELTKRSGFHGI